MRHYPTSTLAQFRNLRHVYDLNDRHQFFTSAGDVKIGEMVNLYFDVEQHTIIRARFSAIGSVMLLVAAEHLCSVVEGRTITDALIACDPNNGTIYELKAITGREHSFNFVIQAFYDFVAAFTNHQKALT